MTLPATGPADIASALYVDDAELRRRINPKMGMERFRAALKAAEAQGFPKERALWGGRYWPAVRAWLDRECGIAHNAGGDGVDGPENFDAPARQSPRTETRPHRPRRHDALVLDGEAGGARPDGLPRPVHSAAGGR
jgi:hypothetical protein